MFPNMNKWGFRVPIPSEPYQGWDLAVWNSKCHLLFGSGGVLNGNAVSTSTAVEELEGGLVRVMYQGVCAGLQGWPDWCCCPRVFKALGRI